MATRELNIEDLDRRFNEILSSLSTEDVLNWLEKDKEDQMTKLFNGSVINISSLSTAGCIPYFVFAEITDPTSDDPTSYRLAA